MTTAFLYKKRLNHLGTFYESDVASLFFI